MNRTDVFLKKGLCFILAGFFLMVPGLAANADAYELSTIDAIAAASGGVQEHPESGTQFDGYSGVCTSSALTDCYWDLGESVAKAWFFISTDHYDPTPVDYFSFDIYTSSDLTSMDVADWDMASFTGTVNNVTEEPPGVGTDVDDYAMLYSFSSAAQYIRAIDTSGNTHRTGLYHPTDTCVDPDTGLSEPCVMPGVEWDGVAPVPEPATLLLVGTGLAGAGYVRRKFSKR